MFSAMTTALNWDKINPYMSKNINKKTEISVIQFSYQRIYKKRRAGVTLMSCSWTVPGPDRPGG
jgi:hypothetical protein